jgi:hypothetical protein
MKKALLSLTVVLVLMAAVPNVYATDPIIRVQTSVPPPSTLSLTWGALLSVIRMIY